MKPADHVRTPRAPTYPAARLGRSRFLRHYLEMVAAMLVGMVALGAALRGVLALAGLPYPTRSPELTAPGDGPHHVGRDGRLDAPPRPPLDQHPRDDRRHVRPAVALIPLLWLGVIDGNSLLMLEHLVMLPLMFLVMLRRRAE